MQWLIGNLTPPTFCIVSDSLLSRRRRQHVLKAVNYFGGEALGSVTLLVYSALSMMHFQHAHIAVSAQRDEKVESEGDILDELLGEL